MGFGHTHHSSSHCQPEGRVALIDSIVMGLPSLVVKLLLECAHKEWGSNQRDTAGAGVVWVRVCGVDAIQEEETRVERPPR